jgi:hypothetical protein
VPPAANEPRVAIVTTLRNAASVIDSFLAYHRAIGFAHFFLYFDDPNDPDLARIAAMPGVTALPHDQALREAWKTLPLYAEKSPFIDSEVMARQVLNVEHAMGLARSQGLDWLLNIDADELFCCMGVDLAETFAHLSRNGAETGTFFNFEAVPEKLDIADYFREVDAFKLQPTLYRGVTAAGMRLLRSVPQLQPNIFHFYGSGKAAVNLSAPGMRPLGVHFFERVGAPYQSVHSGSGFILHYACCGFEHFWAKYMTLGRFADTWWGKDDIRSLVPFHLEARDVVAAGSQDAAREFYRRRFAIEDRNVVAALLQHGFLMRITQPRRILESLAPSRRSAP